MSTGDVCFAQRDLRVQSTVVGVQGSHLAHGLGQRRLGLLHGNLRVGRVKLHQGLSGFNKVSVIGQDRCHRSTDLRRNLNHIALNIRVVRLFLVATGKPSEAAVSQS